MSTQNYYGSAEVYALITTQSRVMRTIQLTTIEIRKEKRFVTMYSLCNEDIFLILYPPSVEFFGMDLF